jgi:hypothetical protein
MGADMIMTEQELKLKSVVLAELHIRSRIVAVGSPV